MFNVRLPSSLSDNNILNLLKEFEFVFKNYSKRSGLFIYGNRVKKTSLFCQLLLFKFIAYSSRCNKFSSPKYLINDYLSNELKNSGFRDLIKDYTKPDSKSRFLNDKAIKSGMVKGFFIAPLHLLRGSTDRTSHEERFIKSLNIMYGHDRKIISLTSTCMSEIFMNFWEHATIDAGTVMVAKGNQQVLNIMFADTGDGIITNVKSFINAPDKDLLSFAIKRGTTSKANSYHMGWGLWLVSELCKINNGTLRIFSEGYSLTIENGIQKTIQCPYWKGTIIQLLLPLDNPKVIADIKEFNNSRSKIKIRWAS